MNPLYNYRPFIYRDRENIDEFLEESELWELVYYVFVCVKDNSYRLKVSAVDMFNEVRYQCVRLMLDKHPEEDFYNKYRNDARDNLGTRYASDLCFSMVFAVLSMLKNPPRQIPLMCNLLRLKQLRDERYYFPHFKELVDTQTTTRAEYEIDLKPQPERPEKFQNIQFCTMCVSEYRTDCIIERCDADWWHRVTSDFKQEKIREIVALWSSKEEKLKILQVIEDAFEAYSKKDPRGPLDCVEVLTRAHLKFFNQLRNEVQASLSSDKKNVSTPNETTEVKQLKIEIARLNADIALLNREIVELNNDNVQLRLVNEKDEDAISCEVKRLNAEIEQLRNSKGKSDDAQAFDKFIDKLVEYLEGKPSSDNQYIYYVKNALRDTFDDELTKPQKSKIRKLGNKEPNGDKKIINNHFYNGSQHVEKLEKQENNIQR